MNEIIECIAAAMGIELDNKIIVSNNGLSVVAANGTNVNINLKIKEV